MADDTRTAAQKADDLEKAKAAEAARVAGAKEVFVAHGKDPDERVMIKNPSIDALGGPVPRHTILTTWADLGWSEVE